MTSPDEGLRLSHVLILVNDLHAAVADYQAAGFTLTWGGPPDSAHNALIWFEAGPFLELLLPPTAAGALPATLPPGVARRLGSWSGDEGLCEFAVETDDAGLAATVARLRESGVATSHPLPFSRTTPDGTVVRWELAFPDDLDLPFVMSAYDPPQGPGPGDADHANGARAIASLTLRATAPADLTARLGALLGAADPHLVVVASDSQGPGIQSIELEGVGDLDAALLHGAAIASA